MTSTRTRGTRDDLYSLDKFIVKAHRSAAGTAWRWRTELLTLGGLLAALAWLSGQITVRWAAVVLAAAIGIIFAIPISRRFIVRRFWCVLARHRFHRLCWEARLHTRAGRLPAICWIRPTKVGERAWIICRAGICADDFDAYKQEIAAACYAREARVVRNKKWSQLVTLDIVRHDPLGTTRIISSVIHAKTATSHESEEPAWPSAPPLPRWPSSPPSSPAGT